MVQDTLRFSYLISLQRYEPKPNEEVYCDLITGWKPCYNKRSEDATLSRGLRGDILPFQGVDLLCDYTQGDALG